MSPHLPLVSLSSHLLSTANTSSPVFLSFISSFLVVSPPSLLSSLPACGWWGDLLAGELSAFPPALQRPGHHQRRGLQAGPGQWAHIPFSLFSLVTLSPQIDFYLKWWVIILSVIELLFSLIMSCYSVLNVIFLTMMMYCIKQCNVPYR